ncbi:cytoskeleton-associated protein 2 [Antennarius striatus]|uniref:cytoskeleton-associated protein 2 n=1 Tax=Antennarius striatus TaxID=241820 RepID=UPI0035AE76D8
MDNVAVSRRNRKLENKENTQPVKGYKSLVKSEKTSNPPFQLKSNKKDETKAKNDPSKSKGKIAEARSKTSGDLKKVMTVQSDVKLRVTAEAKHRRLGSQTSLKEQPAKDKTVAHVPKPPAAVPSSKPAPGMYKGKIVQSKIGAIWKSSANVQDADMKPESQRVRKVRSESVGHLPGQKSAQTRPKLVVNRPVQAATSHRLAKSWSARPTAKTIPAASTTASSRNTGVISNKRNGAQSSKLEIPVTDRKVKKPPVSTTLSQYRLTTETAEEKRAKLAEWKASKGKTLKRPAMTTAAPSKTSASAKPKADPEAKLQLASQCNPQNEPHAEADPLRAKSTTHSTTSGIMETSLDLLDASHADPGDPQEEVNDIVVNLCDALEAMVTPSRCNDDLLQVMDGCGDVKVEESKPKDGCQKEEIKDVSEQLKVEQVKDEEGTDEEVQSDECVMETSPQKEVASLIKYSVKTTPYLQSVKKTIADDACANSSKRKSNIKDLKFLTPVRRSCRIQRKSSHLPSMLHDHDPCVSSLAELVKLDDESNAYIYRKNPSLLEELPDQTRE